MAKPTLGGRDCPDLLAFEEVSRRLGLKTRLPVGRRGVAVAYIVGSVGRVADIDVPMDWDWGIPPAVMERGIENLVDQPRTRWSRRTGGLSRRPTSPETVLLSDRTIPTLGTTPTAAQVETTVRLGTKAPTLF